MTQNTLFPNWELDEDDETGFIRDYFEEKKLPFTEETMIHCLSQQNNKHELYWAILALRMIGTKRCIEPLKKVATYPNLDVQGLSVMTIAKFANGTENEFLAGLLLDKAFKAKWYAVYAFNFKANNHAVTHAITYGLKTIKSAKNKPEAGSLIVEYLARFAPENTEAKKIFARINHDFDQLSAEEKSVFSTQFPHIFGKS